MRTRRILYFPLVDRLGSTTATIYVGKHYEAGVNSGHTSYYFAGAKLIALRRVSYSPGANDLRFVFQDHLGSTTVLANSSAAKVWEDQFLPYGKVWYHWDGTSGTFDPRGLAAQMERIVELLNRW